MDLIFNEIFYNAKKNLYCERKNFYNAKKRFFICEEIFGVRERRRDKYKNFIDINLILNNASHDLLEKDKINILWVQHFVNQNEVKNLGSKEYLDKLDYIVFNSNWNFEKFVYQFKVPESKSLVIRNAVEKIHILKNQKIK